MYQLIIKVKNKRLMPLYTEVIKSLIVPQEHTTNVFSLLSKSKALNSFRLAGSQVFPNHFIQEEKKFWKMLLSNPAPLSPQMTILTKLADKKYNGNNQP